jgi:hypothetical protein
MLPNTTFTSIPLASSSLGLCKLNVSYVIFKSLTYSFSVSTSSVITFCLCSAFFFLEKYNIITTCQRRQSVKLYTVWGLSECHRKIKCLGTKHISLNGKSRRSSKQNSLVTQTCNHGVYHEMFSKCQLSFLVWHACASAYASKSLSGSNMECVTQSLQWHLFRKKHNTWHSLWSSSPLQPFNVMFNIGMEENL